VVKAGSRSKKIFIYFKVPNQTSAQMKRLPSLFYIIITSALLLPACGGDRSGTAGKVEYDEIWKDPGQSMDARIK